MASNVVEPESFLCCLLTESFDESCWPGSLETEKQFGERLIIIVAGAFLAQAEVSAGAFQA